MRHRLWHVSLTHGFEIATALVWLLVGFAWLIDPTNSALHSPVGRQLSWWTSVWALGQIVACPLIVYGIWFRDIRARGFGLSILATALIGQGMVAVFFAYGDPRSYTYWIFGAFCVLKVLLIKRVYVDNYTYQM